MSERLLPGDGDLSDEERYKEVLASLYHRYQTLGRGVYGGGHSYNGPRRRLPARSLPSEVDSPIVDGSDRKKTWQPPVGMYRSKTGTGPSKFDPQLIADVVDTETSRRGWTQQIGVGKVVGLWPKIVGPLIAQHCQIERFEQGELIIRADSSAWSQQLRLLLPQIHKNVDEVVGKGVIHQIVVKGPQGPSWKHGKWTVPGRGPRDTYG